MKKIFHFMMQLLLSITMIFTSPYVFTEIHADGLDVRSAISQIIGSHVNTTYHYSYDGGKYFDRILSSDDSNELYSIGLDCTSGTLAIVSKAIRNAGADPYEYFGDCRNYLNNVYPYELSTHFTNMTKVADNISDSSSLLPGDIIVYGQMGEKGHMNVYCGNNETFDFGSNGNGAIGNYKGFSKYVTFKSAATSTTGSYGISAVYRLNMSQTIQYSIIKKSSDSQVSDTSQYSLATATFGVYTNSSCTEESRIDTLTTDSNGQASGSAVVSRDVQTIYVKELSAPINFMVSDTSIHTIFLQNGSGSTEFTDAPLYASQTIEIYKIDKEGKKDAAPMDETEFTIDYYDTLGSVENLSPYASWTIKTIGETTDSGTNYVARMDDAHLVSGGYIRNHNNQPVLPIGTIVIKETKAASDYTIEGGFLENGVRVSSTESMMIQVVNENGSVVMKAGNQISNGSYQKEETVIRGSYEIQKKDIELMNDVTNGVRSQGDASFANAEFDLYYLGDGSNQNVSMMIDHDGDGLGDGSEYLPSETSPIDHIVLDASGHYTTPNGTYLAYGNYRLVETKSPVGYSHLDVQTKTPVTITFTIQNNQEHITLEAYDKVYEGDIQILKTQNTTNTSAFTKPEQGAVFAIVLKKYVLEEANGREVTRDIVIDAYHKAESWHGYDESQHEVNGYTPMEYDLITTDINGSAKSRKLAYGDYYLAQVSSASELKTIEDIEEFSIHEEHQDTIVFHATNDTKGYLLKIFKKDANTKQRVTYTSSAFKIHMLKDMEGNDVSNKTTKNTSISSRLVNGYVVQTLGENTNQTNYDVFMSASLTQAISNDALEEGVFYGVSNSKENNVDSCTCLPVELMPGEYQLEEVVTSDGFMTSSPLQFTIHEDSITRVNENKQNIIEIEFENKRLTGDVSFTKEIIHYQDADESLIQDDLTQFGFTLYAKNDIYSPDDGTILVKKDEVAVRLTDNINQPYEQLKEVHPDEEGNFSFSSLPLGEYYLKETTVPKGFIENDEEWDVVIKQSKYDHYIKEQTSLPFGMGEVEDGPVSENDISITINEQDTNHYQIQNEPTKTELSKKSITGSDELEGATLHLSGNGVDMTWISTDKPYRIEGLPQGEYTLSETSSPNGYYYHEDITFTVDDKNEVKKVEMKDQPIRYQIKKVDEEGNPVSGVKLKLFDRTDDCEIALENDGITTLEPFILNQVLIAGHEYELIEEEIVDGVFQATSLTFVVPKICKEECITITMIDQRVGIVVNKVDEEGNPVVGAKMQILKATQSEEGKVVVNDNELIVYEFTTSDTYEDISEYVKGSDENTTYWYVLREVEAPFGYEMMEDMAFTVTGTKQNYQTLQAVDVKKDYDLQIIKKDESDQQLLKDAEFTLYHQDGTIVKDIYGNECISKTDDKGVVLFQVAYNEGDYVKETKAPEGYYLNEQKFIVSFHEDYDYVEPMVIEVKDKKIETVITKDAFHLWEYGAVMAISLIGCIYFMKQRMTH